MSFRFKTILGIALIEAILLIILIVTGLDLLGSIQQDGLSKRAESTTKVLASTAKEAVLASDLATLDTFTSEFIRNPEVIYIRILDTEQDILSAAGLSTAQDFEAAGIENSPEHIITSRSQIIVEDTLFGYVEAAYSKKDLIEIYGRARTSAIVIAITELVLVALFSFFLGTYLSSQLSELKRSAEKVAAGDFSVCMKEHGNDEIAQVTQAFNLMTEKLRAKKQIDDINIELIESVQHTQPVVSDRFSQTQLYEQVLERILKLTTSHFGMILTWDNNTQNEQILSAIDTNWSNSERIRYKRENFNTLKLDDIIKHVQQTRDSGLAEIINEHTSLIDDGPGLESYILIPVLHHAMTIGVVLLANEKNTYNKNFLIENNKLAWISIANLIYIISNNDYLTQIQKKLTGQKNFVTSIYDSVPDAIISISNRGIITSLNQATCNIFGYSEEELLGQNISILMPEPYRSAHDGFLSSFVHANDIRKETILTSREFMATSKAGELIPIDIMVNLLDDPESNTSYVGIIKDITRQKKQIEEIKYANRLATQSYIDRHHFTTAISNIVLSPAQQLNRTILGALLSNQHENLSDDDVFRKIYTESNELLHNTENVVYYTHLLLGSIRIKKGYFSLPSLFDEVNEEINLDRKLLPVNIQANPGDKSLPYYFHDKKHIKLILSRLIHAMLNGHQDITMITLSAESIESLGKKDRIKLDMKAELNEPASESILDTEDMGVKVANLMISFINGNQTPSENIQRIEVKQDQTTITLSIQLDLTRAQGYSGLPSTAYGMVLLVDDDKQFLKLSTQLLENIGFIAHTAQNGREMLDMYMQNSYTAILLDCSMPVMTGQEAARIIREYEESKSLVKTPIIAMTGHIDQDELESCLVSGMNDYLKKPFNIEDVLTKLGLHIQDNATLSTNTLFAYHVMSEKSTMKQLYKAKVIEYLKLILTNLNLEQWEAVKYCIASLQNMSLATRHTEIYELAIQLEYQANLTDSAALEETIRNIKKELDRGNEQSVDYSRNMASGG